MSNDKHTKEPWVVSTREIPHRLGSHKEHSIFTAYIDGQLKDNYPVVTMSVGIGLEGAPPVHFVGTSEENARRIVACVNALQGVRTEWLEEAVAVGITDISTGNLFSARLKLQQRITELQRDVEMFKHGLQAADDKLIELHARNNELEREIEADNEHIYDANETISVCGKRITDLERQLAEWKIVSAPILDYGQSRNDLPLGASIIEEAIKAWKERDELKAQLAEAHGRNEGLLAGIKEARAQSAAYCIHEILDSLLTEFDKALAAEVVK